MNPWCRMWMVSSNTSSS